MTQPPETRIEPAVAVAPHRDRLLSPARYRHPGDVIRLIIAGAGLGLFIGGALNLVFGVPSSTTIPSPTMSWTPGVGLR